MTGNCVLSKFDLTIRWIDNTNPKSFKMIVEGAIYKKPNKSVYGKWRSNGKGHWFPKKRGWIQKGRR